MRKNREGGKNAVSHSLEKKHRRLFSAAVVLLVCCLAFVGAVGAADFSGGSGTLNDPYQITTTEDFNNIKFGNSGKNTHYKLMNDLDFGYNAPDKFGTKGSTFFYGVFDGNGHTISNISYQPSDTDMMIGLFAKVLSGAQISNLSVANVSLTVSGDIVKFSYGTIAGCIAGYGGSTPKATNNTVKNVTVILNFDKDHSGHQMKVIGGMFGNVERGAEVCDCSISDFIVRVNYDNTDNSLSMEGIGGIGSQIVNGGTVTRCSVDNFVVYSPNIQYIKFLGVIVGRVGGACVVSDCFIGDVDASNVKNIADHDTGWDFNTGSYNLIYGMYNGGTITTSGNEIVGSVNIAGVTGWALVADTKWYNEDEYSFEISTAEELAGLAKLVNLGNTFSGKTVVLKEDIDLENKEWTPIGKSLEKSFQGTFEGGWHTVSNLKVTGANENVGLFGYAADAEIRNLTVTEADISGSRNVGGIAGNAGAGTSFINCTCSGEVTANDVKRIGGIAGVWNNTIPASPITLQNSTFTGNLSSKDSRIQSSLTDFPNAGLIGDYSTESGTGILEFIDIELKEPTPRIGYTFLGWKKSDTETVQSPVTLNITKDNPLTEVWKKNNHTITFKDGDTQITILEFEYESSVTAPANPTKDGYIFKGWSPELPETMPDEDITVSAVWEMIPEEPTDEDETNHVIIITPPKTAWQVVFYPNGGEGNMNAEVFVEGEEEALPNNSFYRDGYVFKGWSLTPEGEVFYIDEETVVIDKTTYLYAVWEKIPDTPQTPEKPNIPTIPIIIAGIIVGLLVMIFVITRKRQKEE